MKVFRITVTSTIIVGTEFDPIGGERSIYSQVADTYYVPANSKKQVMSLNHFKNVKVKDIHLSHILKGVK